MHMHAIKNICMYECVYTSKLHNIHVCKNVCMFVCWRYSLADVGYQCVTCFVFIWYILICVWVFWVKTKSLCTLEITYCVVCNVMYRTIITSPPETQINAVILLFLSGPSQSSDRMRSIVSTLT